MLVDYNYSSCPSSHPPLTPPPPLSSSPSPPISPFSCLQGRHRNRLAMEGMRALQDRTDTLIVIPNQNLFKVPSSPPSPSHPSLSLPSSLSRKPSPFPPLFCIPLTPLLSPPYPPQMIDQSTTVMNAFGVSPLLYSCSLLLLSPLHPAHTDSLLPPPPPHAGLADDVLLAGVKSITDLMVRPGLINLDFADVQAVMQGMGNAIMGTGQAEGEDRAVRAASDALKNPLLGGDMSVKSAKGMLVNITGGADLTLFEVDMAAQVRTETHPQRPSAPRHIQSCSYPPPLPLPPLPTPSPQHITKEIEDENANIIFGSSFDPSLQGSIRVSVVATGIDTNPNTVVQPAAKK